MVWGGQPAAYSAKPGLEFRVNPVVDYWFWLHALASDRETVPPGLEASVKAVELFQSLGRPALLCHGLVYQVEDVEALATALVSTAKSLEARAPGMEVAAQDLQGTLVPGFQVFQSRYWPQRQRRLAWRRFQWQRAWSAGGSACLEALRQDLKLPALQQSLPIYLVLQAPKPGGVTYRSRQGAFAVVETSWQTPSLALEVCLHEALHIWHSRVRDRTSFFDEVLALTEGKSLSARDPFRGDFPHMFYFLFAGRGIRDHIDSDHLEYLVETGKLEQFEAMWKKGRLLFEKSPVLADWVAKMDDYFLKLEARRAKARARS
ncbi:MAG: hypothetical protein DWQ01_22255 [Planctomycetota bacterium]|nr:MAG: hypothetical protein DWQ01_22255 [Planctomycetota bacterium]